MQLKLQATGCHAAVICSQVLSQVAPMPLLLMLLMLLLVVVLVEEDHPWSQAWWVLSSC